MSGEAAAHAPSRPAPGGMSSRIRSRASGMRSQFINQGVPAINWEEKSRRRAIWLLGTDTDNPVRVRA